MQQLPAASPFNGGQENLLFNAQPPRSSFAGRWIAWLCGDEKQKLLSAIQRAKGAFESYEKDKGMDQEFIRGEIRKAKTFCEIHRRGNAGDLSGELDYLKSLAFSAECRTELSRQNDVPDQGLLKLLISSAVSWKLEQKLICAKKLTHAEVGRLEELARYPAFAIHLLSSPEELKAFFTWTLRDGNRAAPFVEFRAQIKRITESNLSGRIGFFGGADLRIEVDAGKKRLALPCEGRLYDILDENQIVVFKKGNLALTIKEIFRIFEERAWKFGGLEYFPGEGICNWSPKELGYYDTEANAYIKIDLAGNWWEQLIPMETIDREEAGRRFFGPDGRPLICDGVKWVASVFGKSDSHQLDGKGNHGYLQVGIPDGSGGYKLYPFGKFAERFPQTAWESANLAARFVKGVIAYPDENIFRTDRDQESVSFLWDPAFGRERMDSIRKDLLRARQGGLYFQFLIQNCLLWAFAKAKVSHEEAYAICGTSFLEGCPRGALAPLWKLLRAVPYSVSAFLLTVLSKWLGGSEEVIASGKRGKLRRLCFLASPPWGVEAEPLHPTALILKMRCKKNLVEDKAAAHKLD